MRREIELVEGAERIAGLVEDDCLVTHWNATEERRVRRPAMIAPDPVPEPGPDEPPPPEPLPEPDPNT